MIINLLYELSLTILGDLGTWEENSYNFFVLQSR